MALLCKRAVWAILAKFCHKLVEFLPGVDKFHWTFQFVNFHFFWNFAKFVELVGLCETIGQRLANI